MNATKATPIKNFSNKQGKKLSTLTKLLISKDKQGQFKLRIMKLIGEETYFEKHNYNLSNNTFGKKENDFSGMVMYYDWNERFVNGFQYDKGKVAGEISNSKQSASSERRAVCSTFYVDYYQNVCYTSDVSGWTCSEWTYTNTDSYSTCQYYDEGGSGDGYDNGGGIIDGGDYYGGSTGAVRVIPQ